MDYLLGRFAEQAIDSMNGDEIAVLERLSLGPAYYMAHLEVRAAGNPLASQTLPFQVKVRTPFIGGTPMLDLPYVEDSVAEVDMNVVMLTPADGGEARFVEVQGTAEGEPFDRYHLDGLLSMAEKGCADLTRLQQEALAR